MFTCKHVYSHLLPLSYMFPEDLKSSGNTSAAFAEWGYTCNRAPLRFIKHLILCIYSIYLIYSSIWSTCLHVILFTWLHYILLIYLDFVYCLCVIFFRIHGYMFTSTHVYCLFIIYMISWYSLGFLIQEHTWITSNFVNMFTILILIFDII